MAIMIIRVIRVLVCVYAAAVTRKPPTFYYGVIDFITLVNTVFTRVIRRE
jgi:hypothetical protein